MQVDVVTETRESVLPYQCGGCGLRRMARVRAAGSGSGADGALHADTDRRANADRLIRCAPCPTCGHVDEPYVRNQRVKAIALGVGLGLFGGIAVTPIAVEMSALVGIALFLAAALGTGVPMFRFYRRRWYAPGPGAITFGDPISSQWKQGQTESTQASAPRPPSPFD